MERKTIFFLTIHLNLQFVRGCTSALVKAVFRVGRKPQQQVAAGPNWRPLESNTTNLTGRLHYPNRPLKSTDLPKRKTN